MIADHDARRRELAAIHIAKKDLALDEETYRAMLWTIGRVHSSADLNSEGRHQVLDHLRSRGFKGSQKYAQRTAKVCRDAGPRPRVPADRQAQIGKIEALLAAAGRPWAYIESAAPGRQSMVRRICGVDRIGFATPEQLGKLIAALSYDAQRRAAREDA